MGDHGGDGGAAAGAPALSTAPARGASWAVLLEQRKKEVQDVAGQHRVVSPGDAIKTPHVATVFWFNPLPSICGSPAVLEGCETDLPVWVFLRAN